MKSTQYEYSSCSADNDRQFCLDIHVRFITVYEINMIYGAYHECTSHI